MCASLLLFAILSAVAIAAQTPSLPGATEERGAFALPDPTGARLLVIPDLARPESLKTALCSGGRQFPIRFVRRQTASRDFAGRETPRHFDELAGSLFKVLVGRITADATCFLASESFLAESTPLTIAPWHGADACSRAQRGRFASLRGRPVVHCWPIARLTAQQKIALVEFRHRGKNALASLVLMDADRTIFADYTAEFRGEGEDLWRADDGGVLSPQGFEVICAIQRPNGFVLGVAWAGAEGQSLALWTSDSNGSFTQVISDYWYQAPV